MDILLIRDQISNDELRRLAIEGFGDMVKAVVDLERRIMAAGGEMHADAEQILLKDGSRPESLWGVNIYPAKAVEERLEFTSLINIRPSQGNRGLEIEDETVRNAIRNVVNELVA